MEEIFEPEKSPSPIRDFGIRPRKKSSLNKLFLIGGLVILIIAVAALLLPSKKTSNQQKPAKNSKIASSSANVKSTFCSSGQDFKSTKQGYEVCFPEGWVKNNLVVSDLKVGFDPSKVDSSHEGTILVSINDKAEDLSVQDISNNSSKFEYDKTSLDSVKGTKVIYTRLKSDPRNPKAIDTVVVNQGRTYTISLDSTDLNYEENKAFYEKFLETWKFIKNTPNPPWSNSGNILVFSPWLNATITSPVEVSGEAIAFEGTVTIRIKDGSGHVLQQTTTQTQSGSERSSFKVSIDFDKASSKDGTIEVYIASAKDGSEQDKVTIPIKLQ